MPEKKEKKKEIAPEKMKKLRNFKTESKKKGFHVRVEKEKFAYNQAREISNAYFNHEPIAVAFPRNATQVIGCLTFCKKNNFKVRLRSGGHQHEGMSSADGVFMIRLSDINFLEYADDEKQTAWIGVGCKLKAVYDELELDGKMIPGGGCFNVNVGGLTLGGGWGMNSRKYGLTCDNIIAAEIVFINKEGVFDNEIISEANKPKLFKALRGGGGGNFGIVTRFLFKLHEVSSSISTFSIYWDSNDLEVIVKKWLILQPTLTRDITTFLRIQHISNPHICDEKCSSQCKIEPKRYRLRAYGLYHGIRKDLKVIAEPLLSGLPDLDIKKIQYTPKEKKAQPRGVYSTSSDETTNSSLADLFNYDVFTLFDTDFGTPARDNSNNNTTKYEHIATPPSSNCDAPHPHKVSSIFSNKEKYKKKHKGSDEKTEKDYYAEIGERVQAYFNSNYEKVNPTEVTSYMTFHSFGGKIKEEPKEGTSFAFRDREFLMQFQSWWNYSRNEKRSIADPTFEPTPKVDPKIDFLWEQPYIDWVTGFRKAMSKDDLTEGAFINFVDKLGVDTSIPKDKYNLLKVYYGSKLNDLIDAKKEYDSTDFFNFEMSIPTKIP
jgi:hypothetical protein